MKPKADDRKKAISLRRKGLSYSEISKEIAVSQGSLSLWLRNVKLTKAQKENLVKRKQDGQVKGARRRKELRIMSQNEIVNKSILEIGQISSNELFLIGIMAYWCEGAKQKSNNISQAVVFANSDPLLIKLFTKWLKEVLIIEENRIDYRLYIHERAEIEDAINYWCTILEIQKEKLGKPIIKLHKVKSHRTNTGSEYKGLIRIIVRKSTILNRKIQGWIQGISSKLN